MNSRSLPTPRVRISGPGLRRALIAGARRVIAQREILNRINVFPVPDGDTGSNLAFTLGTVLTGALSRKARGVGDLLRRVGDDAIDGARGNSGAILAQFFAGLAEAVGHQPRSIEPQAMADAIRRAASSARQALAEPREGTILSVISAFADALENRPEITDLRDWFSQAVQRSRSALADTPKQLPVLQKAGVVDAGAQGFVDLLDGIEAFMSDTKLDDGANQEDYADFEASQAHGELGDADPEHRFCTECLILGEGLDRAGIRAALSDLGASCVVVAGSHSRLRLHAHVAAPKQMFEIASHFGRVESCKADDMHAQQRSASNGGSVAIVTDTSADLPDTFAEQLNIHVVPLRVNFGEADYLDKVGLSNAEFYQKMRSEFVLPKTSQPPQGDFRRQFEFLLSHHPSVIYVGLARAVSGTLQCAEAAAQRGHPDRTHVFDSANASAGQALLTIAAARAARDGQNTEQILQLLNTLRPQTQTWAIARDISHAVRGGRIPRWAKPVVKFLGLTPRAKMKPNGKLSMAGAFLGTRNIPERFARYVCQQIDKNQRWRLIVGHCDAPDDGALLLAELRQHLQLSESWLAETGSAVGAHAGPGALVVSVQPVQE
jgi:uncharacterized protein